MISLFLPPTLPFPDVLVVVSVSGRTVGVTRGLPLTAVLTLVSEKEAGVDVGRVGGVADVNLFPQLKKR